MSTLDKYKLYFEDYNGRRKFKTFKPLSKVVLLVK